ncbi:MAG: hypothetical protein ACR2LC_04890 [Pyrinomonadaceae bacterium]
MTNTIPASRYITIDEPPASSAESLIENHAASVQKTLKKKRNGDVRVRQPFRACRISGSKSAGEKIFYAASRDGEHRSSDAGD